MRVFRKAHVKSDSVARLLSSIYSKRIDIAASPQPLRLEKYTQDADMSALAACCPHPQGGVICKNKIEPTYDLQVIIPCYRVEDYVCNCVDSVLGSFSRHRVFITLINDGSPDGTRERLRKYEGLSNVEILDQENRGFSGARNRGLEHIRGSYVTFVDSDDKLYPGALDVLMDAADREQADIVEGGYSIFYTDARRKGSLQLHENKVYKGQWLGKITGYPWGKVYRATLFEKIHFPEGYWFEDTLMSFITYPMAKKIVTISEPVYYYRINYQGISSTSHGNPKCIDSLWITICLLEAANELELSLQDPQLYEMFLAQTRVNLSRMASLHDASLLRYAFAVQVKLWKQYFPAMKASSEKGKKIEQIMKEQNYKHAILNALFG